MLSRALGWVLNRTARPLASDDPGVPFKPRGDLPPLFFLHIPKTGGSSLGVALTRLYGRRNRILHIEGWLTGYRAGRNRACLVDCVTGHLLWREWQGVAGHKAYPAATILRDPWPRLVSHINHNARFLRGKQLPQGGPVSEALARATQLLRGTDFSVRASMERFVDHVRAEADLRHYDNLQVNMLTPWAKGRSAPLPGMAGVQAAMDVLGGMTVIGFSDRPSQFVAQLAGRVGRDVPEQVRDNVTRTRILSADNTMAREVLVPLYEQDQLLYEAARRAFSAGASGQSPVGPKPRN